MYNDTAYLCTATITQDEYLNETMGYTYRKVFVKPLSIGMSEFYSAASAKLKPDLKLVIADVTDYNNEAYVKYHDVMYDVTRTYKNGTHMELTLTERNARDESNG